MATTPDQNAGAADDAAVETTPLETTTPPENYVPAATSTDADSAAMTAGDVAPASADAAGAPNEAVTPRKRRLSKPVAIAAMAVGGVLVAGALFGGGVFVGSHLPGSNTQLISQVGFDGPPLDGTRPAPGDHDGDGFGPGQRDEGTQEGTDDSSTSDTDTDTDTDGS